MSVSRFLFRFRHTALGQRMVVILRQLTPGVWGALRDIAVRQLEPQRCHASPVSRQDRDGMRLLRPENNAEWERTFKQFLDR